MTALDLDDPFAVPAAVKVSHRGEIITGGRYRLPHRDGTHKKRGWMRVTNLVSAYSDQFGLRMWEIEQVLLGLAHGATFGGTLEELITALYAELLGAGLDRMERDERREWVEAFIERCKDVSGGNAGAKYGTHRHAVVEAHHAGLPLGYQVPSVRRQLSLYASALERNKLVALPGMQERRVLIESVEAVGTLDNILRCLATDLLMIGDLKGLALTTPLPTPDGWTTMGAVQVGDRVFDAYGKPCMVTAKSGVKQIGTYVVRFDDGSEVVCDAEHIWWTANGKPSGAPEVRPISEVIDTLRNSQGQAHHRVPVAGALDLPDAELSIDPYLLGVWLGNGDQGGGVITSMRDLFEVLKAEGHALGKETVDPRGNLSVRHTVLGLRTRLTAAGLLGNKHIPDTYLRGSITQRQRLLQGLMDTDGTWNTARRTAVFYTVRKALALQVVELLASLGQRPYMAEVPTRGYGKEAISYHVSFTPVDLVPFRLPRKAAQVVASAKPTTRARRRVIVSVEPGPDVATACIAVDSETHTYLCGDRMIPTHNTQKKFWTWLEIGAQFACYANADAMWDEETGRWVDMPPVSRDIGLVLWMPRPVCPLRDCGQTLPCEAHPGPMPEPHVDVYEVDLKAGWATARRAFEVVADRATARMKDSPRAWLRAAPPPSLTEQYAARFAAVETAAEGSALVAEAMQRGVWDATLAGCARQAAERVLTVTQI